MDTFFYAPLKKVRLTEQEFVSAWPILLIRFPCLKINGSIVLPWTWIIITRSSGSATRTTPPPPFFLSPPKSCDSQCLWGCGCLLFCDLVKFSFPFWMQHNRICSEDTKVAFLMSMNSVRTPKFTLFFVCFRMLVTFHKYTWNVI